jgi:uncharacterized protein (DUF1697 family)
MADYVAFLRGINLGNRRLKMERLRELGEELGFADAATFIASGNLIFASGARDAGKLEKKIETHLARGLGYEVDTFVRTRAEVAALAAARPFAAADLDAEETTIHVGFWKEEPKAEWVRALEGAQTATDAIVIAGREFFWRCRGPSHASKFWSAPAVRAAKLPTMTIRNRRMVQRLTAEFPPR